MRVCYNRPNRTKRRYFKPCDAARIARECLKDDKELTPEQVLACIAKGMGFTHISLSRQRTVESGLTLNKTTIKLGKITLEKSIPILKRLNLPKVIAAISAVIEVLDKIERVVDLLLNQPKQDRVEDAIPKDKCVCKDQPRTETTEKRKGNI